MHKDYSSKMIFRYITKILLIGFIVFSFNIAYADSSSCSPVTTKPTLEETRLANFTITKDVVAVGDTMTLSITTTTPLKKMSLDLPESLEIVDYTPKNVSGITIDRGKWTSAEGDIPTGTYTLFVRPASWTAKKWVPIVLSATNSQGTGYGKNYYYAYYNTLGFQITLDEDNQVAQTDANVVRKVTVNSVPGVDVSLTTSDGSLGTTVNSNKGVSVTQKTFDDGSATFFLFTKEGKNVTIAASSTDTCLDSSVSQKFKIKRSNIANSYTNYNWIYYLLVTVIAVLVIYILYKKKKKKEEYM